MLLKQTDSVMARITYFPDTSNALVRNDVPNFAEGYTFEVE